jgi:hypothetical protein
MAPAGGAAVHASFCSRTAQASGAAWGAEEPALTQFHESEVHDHHQDELGEERGGQR